MNKKPLAIYLLWTLLFFQSVSGLAGGIALMAEPGGSIMHLPITLLNNSPFANYMIPGVILFILLGVFPAFLSYALMFHPHWEWAGFLNIYKKKNWAWTYSLYLGIMLIIWIDVEIWMIGYAGLIQTVFGLVGILIVIFTLMPGVMKYYERE
jgi:hypothetical protein